MTANTETETNEVSCLSVALEYIAAGINCIAIHGPDAVGDSITDPGKQPKQANWQKSRITEKGALRIFKQGDNLGVVMGKTSRIVCIDCDTKDDNAGMNWFHANKDNLGNYILENTPSGGVHLYFKYPEDLEGMERIPSFAGKGRLFPGVDFLADGGRQVVTWPSIHPKGGQYTFQNNLNLIDVQFEADELPKWIMDIVKAKVKESENLNNIVVNQKGIDPKDASKLDRPSEILRAREVVRSFPAAIQGQFGDDTTWLAAQQCRKYALTPSTTLKVLLEEYNPRCVPPWPLEALKSKVRSAYKNGKYPLGTETAEAAFDDLPQETIEEEIEQHIEAQEEQRQEELTRYSLKRPVLSAHTFLHHHGEFIRAAKDVTYYYKRDRNVWGIASDTEFKGIILNDVKLRDATAYKAMTPSKLNQIAEIVKITLESTGFEAIENTWLIPTTASKNSIRFKNAILDIESGEVVPHTPEWFSSTILPYDYSPEATCPEFDKFLTSVWHSDADIKECFQLWLGYLLLSDITEQKFALLIGASRAGKGVMARLMERLIGKECSVGCTLSALANDHGLSMLVGKRLVVFGEVMKAPGNTGEIATERLVSIIGMDPQVINRKFGDIYSTTLPVKIVMACNEFPLFMNSRQALTNRMLVFPFTESFAGKEDPKLEERLHGELPGIINWAIVGAKKLLAGERLRVPKVADATILDIKRKMDSVLAFMMDCATVHQFDPWDSEYENLGTETIKAYEAYKEWCDQHGHSKKNMENFISSVLSYSEGNVAKERVRRNGSQVTLLCNFQVNFSQNFGFN